MDVNKSTWSTVARGELVHAESPTCSIHINALPRSTVARGEFEHAKTPTAGRRATTVENSGLSPPTPAHALQLTSLMQALASLRTASQLLRGVCLHPPFPDVVCLQCFRASTLL